MKKDEKPYFTIRERMVITLTIFIIQMIKPWEYDHQFTKFWDEIKSLLSNNEPTTHGQQSTMNYEGQQTKNK